MCTWKGARAGRVRGARVKKRTFHVERSPKASPVGGQTPPTFDVVGSQDTAHRSRARTQKQRAMIEFEEACGAKQGVGWRGRGSLRRKAASDNRVQRQACGAKHLGVEG